MNKLQEDFGEKGLAVLGITGTKEDRAKTLDWVKDLGVEYPFAFANTAPLMEAADAGGYPSAAIISPGGEIVWTGHPSEVTSKLVKDSIKGAAKHLTFGWSEDFMDAAKALSGGDFGKALDAAQKSSAEGAEAVVKEINAIIDGQVKVMTDALAEKDYLKAQNLAEELEDALKGLPQAEEATKTTDAIAGHPDAKDVIKGQKKLAKLMESDLRKKGAVEKAIKKAGSLAEKHAGTIVETHAKAWIKKLKAS